MKQLFVILGLLALVAPADTARAAGGGTLQAAAGTFKMQTLGSGSVPLWGPVIEVEYDRDLRRYTQVKTSQIRFPVAVTMGCDSGWNFTSFTIDAAGVRADASMGGLAKTPSGWSGTTWADRAYKAAAAVGNPIEICNSGLELFVDQGKHGIAQKGWAKKYYNAYPVEVSLVCRKPGKKKLGFSEPDAFGGDSADIMFAAWVHCLPAPVFQTTSGPKPPVKKAGLQSAEVWINPMSNADYKGPCPKKLTFGGKANFLKGGQTPYELHYRYRTKDGDASPIMKTTFDKSGEQILKSWQKNFGAGGPAGQTFKAAGAPSGPQVISSWVKLEILASKPPHQVIATRQGNHRLTCEAQPDPGTTFQAGGSGPGGGKPPIATAKLAAPTAKPDLRIVSVVKHGSEGKALLAVVTNGGSGASKATRLKLFYHRSGKVATSLAAVPPLKAGESRRVVIASASPLKHASSLSLRVDDPNVNAETDEGNNSFQVQ
jgi:hypothetical protein